ncbi:MAG: hypothetical protein IKE11_05790 [Clostridia bacterium]|nr:hypothetical protein [Clostridia bacterium]
MMAIMAAFLPFLFEQNYTTNRPPLAIFLRIGRISLRYGPVSEQDKDKDKEKEKDNDKDKDIYILSLRERAPGGEREKYICPPFGGYGCLFVRENPNAHLAKRLGMVYNVLFNGEEGPSPDMRQGARQWKKHRRSKTSSRKP